MILVRGMQVSNLATRFQLGIVADFSNNDDTNKKMTD